MLVAEIREHFQHILNEFERARDSMVLQINAGQSKGLEREGSCQKMGIRGGGNARGGQV